MQEDRDEVLFDRLVQFPKMPATTRTGLGPLQDWGTLWEQEANHLGQRYYLPGSAVVES